MKSLEYRCIRRLVEMHARYDSHLDFLEHCYKIGIIPKGFRLKWKLNLNCSSDDTLKIRNILEQTSNGLILQGIQVCKAKVSHLLKEIDGQKEAIRKIYTSEEAQYVKERLLQ